MCVVNEKKMNWYGEVDAINRGCDGERSPCVKKTMREGRGAYLSE